MGRKESPAWGYAERLSAGKNPQIRCTQAGCGHVFTGNATRLEAHFLGSSGDVQACKDPPAALVEQLKKAREEKQRKEACRWKPAARWRWRLAGLVLCPRACDP
jgi:hypothetical protein